MSQSSPKPLFDQQWMTPPGSRPGFSRRPPNEIMQQNGKQIGKRYYDRGRNAYVTKYNLSSAQQAAQRAARSGLKSAVQGAQGLMGQYSPMLKANAGWLGELMGTARDQFQNMPQNIEKYKQAFRAPQERALQRSYNEAKGKGIGAANARGVRSSVGFMDYLADKIERQKAEGMADIAANAELAGYDLPGKMMNPYLAAFNLANQSSGSMGQALNPYMNAFNLFQGAEGGTQGIFTNMNNAMQGGAALGQNLYNSSFPYYRPNLVSPSGYQQPGQGGLLGGLF